MKIALLYYDEFAEFEAVLVGLLFRNHEFVAVGLEDREYRSEEQQRFCVDEIVKDVDIKSIDLFVIPGGEPEFLVNNLELKEFIKKLLARDKKVAGICGGAAVLASFGFLKGKRCTGLASATALDIPEYQYFSDTEFLEDQVVVDGNIITAQGQAYVEFAFELAKQMGLLEKEEEYEAGIQWFRNIN